MFNVFIQSFVYFELVLLRRRIKQVHICYWFKSSCLYLQYTYLYLSTLFQLLLNDIIITINRNIVSLGCRSQGGTLHAPLDFQNFRQPFDCLESILYLNLIQPLKLKQSTVHLDGRRKKSMVISKLCRCVLDKHMLSSRQYSVYSKVIKFLIM